MWSRGARYASIFAVVLICIYFVRPAYVYVSSQPTVDQRKCHLQDMQGDPRNAPRPSPSGTVKVIQLTDLGEYVDRCQITDALYELNWDRKVGPPPDFNVAVKHDAVKKPRFVVLYVHGWHNNAGTETGDLPSFHELMDRLAKANMDKQVIGIYVSWEANSEIPIWRYLNFWQKMSVADRIAASGNVTNVIGAVSTIVANAPLGGQFITIGHSFGARILMASTLQNTIAAIQKAHPGRPNADYRTIDGLAQTTILLNPAFEAAYWTPIDAIRRHEERFSQDQKPVVLVIATDNDAATGYAFPLGQSVAWKTGANEITTLGNFPAFWTHDLSRTTEPVCQGTNNEKGLTEQYSAGEVCLRRTEGFAHNPFMLVRSHSDLLNGHNGIWDAGFTAWLFQYLDELGKQLPPKPRDN